MEAEGEPDADVLSPAVAGVARRGDGDGGDGGEGSSDEREELHVDDVGWREVVVVG